MRNSESTDSNGGRFGRARRLGTFPLPDRPPPRHSPVLTPRLRLLPSARARGPPARGMDAAGRPADRPPDASQVERLPPPADEARLRRGVNKLEFGSLTTEIVCFVSKVTGDQIFTYKMVL